MNRAPGFFRATAVMALKDLRLEWRTLDSLGTSTLFSIIVLLLFHFAFDPAALREIGAPRVVAGALWLVVLFGSVVGLSRAMSIERLGDTMAAMAAAPVDRGALFLGKFLANLVRVTALQWIVLPLSALLFSFDLGEHLAPLVLVLFVNGFGLTVLGTLFAAVAMQLGRGETLVATLLVPAASPLLIGAARSTVAVLEGKGLSSESTWLLGAVGFDVLYLFVALTAFEFVLEE